MSTSAPSPAAGPPQGGDDDPRGLHDLALDAQGDIQKLAVGLAHAGAAPEAVAQLTKMGTILSQVVKVLGGGAPPVGGPPGAAPGGPPAAVAAGGPPHPGGAPAPGGAGPSTPGPAPLPPPHESMLQATHHLHNAMVASSQSQK